MSDRRCPYCQQVFEPAPYHPQQLVCNQPDCQRQRRSNYHLRRTESPTCRALRVPDALHTLDVLRMLDSLGVLDVLGPLDIYPMLEGVTYIIYIRWSAQGA